MPEPEVLELEGVEGVVDAVLVVFDVEVSEDEDVLFTSLLLLITPLPLFLICL